MSGGNALGVSLAAASGVAGAAQVAILSRFGHRIGTMEAVAFSTLVTAVVGVAALLLVRQSFAGYADGFRSPPWFWIAGVFSTFIVFSFTVAAPRIGTFATIGLSITGNLTMGAVIDRFGLLGVEPIPLRWPRVLGILLLAAGAALSLRK
jgi:transporter family-2 protein